VKLTDILSDLDLAGGGALADMCLQPVTDRRLTLVPRGELAFPAVARLKLRGDALQTVHLGCDSRLARFMADRDAAARGGECAVETLARAVLANLSAGSRGGRVEMPGGPPSALHARGIRTFQLSFECPAGRLMLLAEVPSRTEVEEALASDFLERMADRHLPRGWAAKEAVDGPRDVDSCLEFLVRVEGDLHLEVPAGGDLATVHTGLLLGTCELEGRRGLVVCVDLADPDHGEPAVGARVQVSAGVGDRSLEFGLPHLGLAVWPLAGGMELPCAVFGMPRTLQVRQRRKAFRVAVAAPVTVELIDHDGSALASPWSDAHPHAPATTGRLADLSFTGARIVADPGVAGTTFAVGGRLTCRMRFAGREAPVSLQAQVRRSTAGTGERDRLQEEIGVEFLVTDDADREALEFVREYVLQVQRAQLARRLTTV